MDSIRTKDGLSTPGGLIRKSRVAVASNGSGNGFRYLVTTLLLALLSACASSPFEVDDQDIAPWTPVQALHEPDAQGALVMWGGQIVAVTNYADYSEVEIVSLPLRRGGQPRVSDEVGIRFITRVGGFLEPVLYANGRYLTVLGVVDGATHIAAGETLLRAPVLAAQDWHLWPKDESRWQSRVNFGVGVGIRL